MEPAITGSIIESQMYGHPATIARAAAGDSMPDLLDTQGVCTNASMIYTLSNHTSTVLACNTYFNSAGLPLVLRHGSSKRGSANE